MIKMIKRDVVEVGWGEGGGWGCRGGEAEGGGGEGVRGLNRVYLEAGFCILMRKYLAKSLL